MQGIQQQYVTALVEDKNMIFKRSDFNYLRMELCFTLPVLRMKQLDCYNCVAEKASINTRKFILINLESCIKAFGCLMQFNK
jgi:hypothetical protein